MTVASFSSGRLELAEALQRLSELGPPSEIRSHAAAEAALAVGLDRALLTSVTHSRLVVEALHVNGDRGEEARLRDALGESAVPIKYPLIESEVIRRRRAQVTEVDSHTRGRYAFGEELGWTGSYVIAPVILESRVAGLLQGDRHDDRPGLDEADAANLQTFASCLALVFERAVLRQRLRTQQFELRRIASLAQARSGQLSDGSIALSATEAGEDLDPNVSTHAAAHASLRDLLTKRETEVLELMVHGDTNAAIARELVLSAGTVKFHVQNILRKLQANNRAEAIVRYLRVTMQS